MPVSYEQEQQAAQPSGGVAYDDQGAPKPSGADQALGIGGAGLLGLIGGALWRKKFPGVSYKDAGAFLSKLHGSISNEIDEGGLPAMYRDFKEYVQAAKAADPEGRVPNFADYIHSRSADAAPNTLKLLSDAQYAGPNTLLENARGLEKPRLPAQIAADARTKAVPPDVSTFSSNGGGRDDLGDKVAHLAANIATAHVPGLHHGIWANLGHLGGDALDPWNLMARSGNRVLFEEPRFNLDGDYVPNDNVQSFVDAQDAPARVRALKALLPSSTARTGAVAGMALGAGADGSIGNPVSGLPYIDDDQQGQ